MGSARRAVMIGSSLNHYKILEAAGEGGMATVYVAEDTRLKRQVALKVLPQEAAADIERLERFHREAEVIAALNHPNIVTIFSVEECRGVHFMTMELVRGETLSRRIPENGLEVDELLDLAVPLAEALAAAHAEQITHRDLKPDNVMVGESGWVKVLDFGLAKLVAPLAESELSELPTQPLTAAGMVLGTLQYMSPEQVQGLDVDRRSDVFSLGVVLYEMATGRRPFTGDNAAELISSILRDEPPRLHHLRPSLPRRLCWLIERCLIKEPQRRLQTAEDLRNELEALLREGGETESDSLRSIAVLPFADMSAEQDQGYFCEGIAEEILNALTRVESLQVAARSSAFLFKDRSLDAQEIGSRLNVAAVLEGSVRKAGERVRITAQLVDVDSGFQLWSERFDRQMEDIFAVQDEIAASIVRTLEVTLSPRERQALTNRPTGDIEAYEFYLRGRQYIDETTRRGFEFALGMFDRAVEIDPGFAPAHAGIADCHSWLFFWFGKEECDISCADDASRRAVELAPDLAEAHASRGFALTVNGRSDEATREFERAIELNPRLFEAYYFYARDRYAAGDLERAAELFELAAEVRPEDYQAPLLLPQVYRSLGRDAEVEVAWRRGLARAKARLALNPDDARALYLGSGGLLELGQRETAIEWIERALDLRPDDPTTLYNSACFYSRAGLTEESLDCLERVVASGSGFKDWIERDSDLDPVRGERRYRDLVARMR